MKIRNGFVSNSSTTSFVIYGVAVSNGDMRELMKSKGYDGDMYDFAEDLAKEMGVKYNSGQEAYYYYFGENPSDMGMDETRRQFQERIQKAIATVFPNEQCGVHSESWYDG